MSWSSRKKKESNFYTLSKYPGGHPIFHQESKLNLQISVGKYEKN